MTFELSRIRCYRMEYCLYDAVVAVSFERPSQEVHESIGYIPVQLKSKGFYSRPFQVFFFCVEAYPVEAESGYYYSISLC